MFFQNITVCSRALTVLAIVLFSGKADAQIQNVKFEHLGIEDGVSHSSVRAIAQDKQGFLWFATPDGLNRYDGYSFKNYRHDPLDSTSVIANSHNTILVDRNGTLWVGTFDGLCRYDAVLDGFITYQHDPEDSGSLSNSYVSSIYEDRFGVLWIGTVAGLNRFDPATDRFVRFSYNPQNPYSFSGSEVTAMLDDPRPGSRILWIGTSGAGLVRFDRALGLFSNIYGRAADLPHLFERYPEQLFSLLGHERLKGRRIAALTEVPDSASRQAEIVLSKPARLLIVCSAESFGEVVGDQGWLEEAASGQSVWHYTDQQSKYGGGHFKNRLQVECVDLPPGRYRLRYQTDESHAFDKWNASPPERAGQWGIEVFAPEATDLARLEALLKESHQPPLLSSNAVRTIIADTLDHSSPYGSLWVGTSQGLNRIQLPEFNQHRDSSGASSDWEASRISRIGQQDPNTVVFTSQLINSIYADQSGLLWLATSAGLNLFDPAKGSIQRYLSDPENSAALSSSYIHTIFEDATGTIWLGTEAGINKLSRFRRQFAHLTSSKIPRAGNGQMKDSFISAIYESGPQKLWIATGSGEFGQLDTGTGQFRHYPFAADKGPPVNRYRVTAIHASPNRADSTLWLGTNGGGLLRFHQGSEQFTGFESVPDAANTLSSNNITAISTASNNKLWIGTEFTGFCRFDPATGDVERFSYPTRLLEQVVDEDQQLRVPQVWSLLEDPYLEYPAVWIGTVGGALSLLNLQTGRYRHFQVDPSGDKSVNNKSITTLLHGEEGRMWIGSYSGGINCYDRTTDRFEHFTVRDGLSNNMIQGMLADSKGNIWVSTNSGISRFDPQTRLFRNYDVNDGLQSNQFNRGAFARGASGRMYFGGINGISSFNPDSLVVNRHPPPVIVTDIRIFDHSITNASSAYPVKRVPVYALDQIELNYSENFFSFEFVALDYTNPRKNSYAYQLKGFDPGWIYCGQRRYVSYTNLDPGKYEFLLKGANSDGVWNEAATPILITIHPPFWKTWWFYFFAISAISAMIYLVHSYRLRVRIEQMIEIERVRKKAAADFHDELGHKLTKISLFSELLQRSLGNLRPADAEYLQRIGELSSSLYHGMRDFLWTLDPEKDSLFEVAIRLKDFGDEFFDQSGIDFHVQGITSELKQVVLTMDWKRHLNLMFKEAMHNSLKHSSCTNVTLSFALDDEDLTIHLIDDGIGHAGINGNGMQENGNELHKNGSGNGLNNMKRRAQKLQSQLQIYNTEPNGSTIRFSGKITGR